MHYKIIRKSENGQRTIIHKNLHYVDALCFLREILENYKKETPHGQKSRNVRKRNKIWVVDGGDTITYEILG